MTSKAQSWHVIEKQIQKEIEWLRNSIETFSNEEIQMKKKLHQHFIFAENAF